MDAKKRKREEGEILISFWFCCILLTTVSRLDDCDDATQKSRKPTIDQLLESAEQNGIVQLDTFR